MGIKISLFYKLSAIVLNLIKKLLENIINYYIFVLDLW